MQDYQQQFISQTAVNFCKDMNQTNDHQQYVHSVNHYDKQVYDHQQAPYPGQMYENLNSQNKQLAIPKEGSLVDHFMRNSFMSDQHSLQQYKTIQNPQPTYTGPALDFMDRKLGKFFVPLNQNYLEYNVNTKQLGNQIQMGHKPHHLSDVDPVGFYRNQIAYMQSMLPEDKNKPNPDQVKNLKYNIDYLGGIEDTVGNMQDSLNNYEIRHLIHKNIRNYPNPYAKKLQVPVQKPNHGPHPFLYNPAEDVERFTGGWTDKSRQPNELEMQQTFQSQFQNSQQQQPYFDYYYNPHMYPQQLPVNKDNNFNQQNNNFQQQGNFHKQNNNFQQQDNNFHQQNNNFQQQDNNFYKQNNNYQQQDNNFHQQNNNYQQQDNNFHHQNSSVFGSIEQSKQLRERKMNQLKQIKH